MHTYSPHTYMYVYKHLMEINTWYIYIQKHTGTQTCTHVCSHTVTHFCQHTELTGTSKHTYAHTHTHTHLTHTCIQTSHGNTSCMHTKTHRHTDIHTCLFTYSNTLLPAHRINSYKQAYIRTHTHTHHVSKWDYMYAHQTQCTYM